MTKYVELNKKVSGSLVARPQNFGRAVGGMFLRLALVTRLGRGNGKEGCAITGGIRF